MPSLCLLFFASIAFVCPPKLLLSLIFASHQRPFSVETSFPTKSLLFEPSVSLYYDSVFYQGFTHCRIRERRNVHSASLHLSMRKFSSLLFLAVRVQVTPLAVEGIGRPSHYLQFYLISREFYQLKGCKKNSPQKFSIH